MLIISVFIYANFEENDYVLAIEEKRYEDALQILNKKPEEKRTLPEKDTIQSLQVVLDVMQYEWPKQSMALKEDEVDPDTVATVKKYINAATKLYLEDNKQTAKKILIHVLHIYADYPKARYFLLRGFEMPSGSYKVQDQVSLLVKRSDHYFYGGSYLKAAEDLEVLAILEKQNPVVYEKLGSAYYMMNLKQKAVDTWTTALFFNPDNKQLEGLINQTMVSIQEDATKDDPLVSANENKVVIEDPQVMGVFKRQSEAFTLMQELRSEGLTVAISENEDAKWVVEVSRKELQEKNSQKGSE